MKRIKLKVPKKISRVPLQRSRLRIPFPKLPQPEAARLNIMELCCPSCGVHRYYKRVFFDRWFRVCGSCGFNVEITEFERKKKKGEAFRNTSDNWKPRDLPPPSDFLEKNK